MKDGTGLALYEKAGELGMAVGVMCFKGLGLHIEEIKALLESSPRTKVKFLVLDDPCQFFDRRDRPSTIFPAKCDVAEGKRTPRFRVTHLCLRS